MINHNNMKITKNVCIHHSIDLDGWISGAVVKHWFEQEKKKLEGGEETTMDFIGYNYGQPIPDLSEYDKVIMCDISFPAEKMYELAWQRSEGNIEFVWLDHHISAINDFEKCLKSKGDYTDYPQGYRDTKFAACELTWKYFFPNDPMPEIVRLLGRYDCFGHKNTEEEQMVLEFQYGARQYISNVDEAYDALVKDIDSEPAVWISEKYGKTDYPLSYIAHEILTNGVSIYQYLCTDARQAYKNGFSINLPNFITVNEYTHEPTPYNFICINKERFNPINFGINYHAEGYDGAMCWQLGTDKMVNISFYNDDTTVDCSNIAKIFGGGGHRGAAGCRMTLEQFNNLIK